MSRDKLEWCLRNPKISEVFPKENQLKDMYFKTVWEECDALLYNYLVEFCEAANIYKRTVMKKMKKSNVMEPVGVSHYYRFPYKPPTQSY